MKLTHGSLFSGIGGFDLAAEWAGFENLFACEFEPFCQKVLAYHFPKIKIYGDIKKTDFSEWRGKVDILTGGFPCQPFSHAGKREGTEDDRYLWPEMLRVVREIRPAWVIGENVAGLTSMVQFSDDVKVEDCTDLFGERYTIETMEGPYVLDRICEDPEQSGYEVQPFVVPACAVGAPHRRDRVWIIAHAENSDYFRRDGGEREIEPDEREQREPCARSDVRIRGEKGIIAHSDNQGTGTGLGAFQGEPKEVPERHHDAEPGNAGAHDVVADTHDEGTGISLRAEREGSQGLGRGVEGAEHREDGGNGAASNPSSIGGGKVHEEVQPEVTDGNELDRVGVQRAVANTKGERGGELQDESEEKGARLRDELLAREHAIPDWERFPTQSPLCSRDDEFSSRLDGITFPAWRRESLKAYGNAIVPRVALEIFKAIKETYKT